jgi:hypothetical protein
MSDEREQIEDPATIGGLGDLIQESPLVQRLRAEMSSLRSALDTAERQGDEYKAEMDRLEDRLPLIMAALFITPCHVTGEHTPNHHLNLKAPIYDLTGSRFD